MPVIRPSRTVSTALVVGATVSLLLAPQATYLVAQRRYCPWTAPTALSVLLGVLLGLLELRLLRALLSRAGEPGAERQLALAHLPCVLLWWPALTGAASPSFRLWVPLAVAAVAALAAAAGWRALRASWGPAATSFVIGTSAAIALSVALVLTRSEIHASVVIAVLWGLYLLVALTGWGGLVNRLLAPDTRLDWGLRAALGLAAAVGFGGLANLTWSVSPGAVALFLAVGAGGWCADAPWRALLRPWRDWPALGRFAVDPLPVLVAAVIAGLALLQLVAAVGGTVETVVANPPFDLHDDLEAYLVFPFKMLQLGSLGAEPFEARRMLSLGGQSFLQTLVLVALPVRTLHLLDAGVALVILIGLVAGAGHRRKLPLWATALALLLVVTLPHLDMRGNTSALLTGAVLLLAWFRLAAEGALGGGLRSAGLVALTAAALAAVKSTFIPAAVGFFATGSVALLLRSAQRRRAGREVALTLALIGVLVLPWMTSLFESSHTLLYPTLGRGFYGGVYNRDFESVHGDFNLTPADLLGALAERLMQLLPALLLVLFVRDRTERAPVLSLAAAALLEAALLVTVGDPNLNRSQSRYLFPVSSAVALGLLVSAFDPAERSEDGRRGPAAAAGLVVGLLLLTGTPDAVEDLYRQLAVNAGEAVAGHDLVDGGSRAAAAELEAALPPGSAVLTTLSQPFLLDFRRHRVLVMSLPGMSSLPPGLPVLEGGEAVADYLVRRGIRYLAYGGMASQRDLFTLTEDRILTAYPRSKMRWAMLEHHRCYRDAALQLAATRKRLYADERTVLLDLTRRVVTVIPAERPQDLEGFRDGIWTTGDGLIRNPGGGRYGSWVVVRTMGWHPWRDEPERLRLEVFADDQRLAPAGAAADAFLFRIDPPRERIASLRLRSATLRPEEAGAAPGGPPLGLDIRAVEIGDGPGIAEIPIRGSAQPIAGDLLPEQAWHRSGFYDDFNWTDGNGRLDGLRWPVPPSRRRLVVALHPVHPWRTEPARLGVRVMVNGIELRPVRAAADELAFALYVNLREIQQIRVISSSFVPHELTGSADARRLGVPVRSLRLE